MPAQAVAAEPELGLRVPSSSTSKAYKASRRKNSVPMAIAAMIAASMLVITAFFVALKDNENLLAKKPDLPQDAREIPIPKDVPPPRDPNAIRETTEVLAPLGSETSTKPVENRTRRPRIGPMNEGNIAEQTPEVMPLVDPEMANIKTPASAIPDSADPSKEKMAEQEARASTASPAETAAVRKALGEALVAMGYRDWDTAEAKLKSAQATAKDGVLAQKVEAVESVSTGVKEFWLAVRESTKSLGAGQELVIGSTRVAVVEANDKMLILRVGGMNKRYPIDDLPMGLARSLASTWFDNNAPSTKVFTGAFLFVEPNGNLDEVRQLWQAARQGGVNMDLLMGLLEDDLKADAKSGTDKS